MFKVVSGLERDYPLVNTVLEFDEYMHFAKLKIQSAERSIF